MTMTDMLTGVVSDGTGACAAIPGYIVAGKTGTSRKAVDGGYSHGRWRRSSASRPRSTRALRRSWFSTNPGRNTEARPAAPVFANIMQFALTRSDVAPDDPGNTQFNAARSAADATGANCDPPPAAPVVTEAPLVTARTPTSSTKPKAATGSLGHDTSQSG
jgi:membrane peptidoglycan carboxypeptidase